MREVKGESTRGKQKYTRKERVRMKLHFTTWLKTTVWSEETRCAKKLIARVFAQLTLSGDSVRDELFYEQAAVPYIPW